LLLPASATTETATKSSSFGPEPQAWNAARICTGPPDGRKSLQDDPGVLPNCTCHSPALARPDQLSFALARFHSYGARA
jgi:hypothetical protein